MGKKGSQSARSQKNEQLAHVTHSAWTDVWAVLADAPHGRQTCVRGIAPTTLYGRSIFGPLRRATVLSFPVRQRRQSVYPAVDASKRLPPARSVRVTGSLKTAMDRSESYRENVFIPHVLSARAMGNRESRIGRTNPAAR